MKLKEFMKKNRWSVTTLAKEMGVDRGTIYGYINGTHYPTPDNIYKLAKTLGISKKQVKDLLK